MNAPFVRTATDNEHGQMLDCAEKWRGECIQQFAKLELSIEDLLQSLAGVARRGRKVRLGEPVGCAFGHLRDLTSEKGAFGREGRAVSRSLQDLAVPFEWRAHLTHGVLTTWKGKSGRWLLTFEHRAPGGGPVRIHALPWTEAEAMRDRLCQGVTDLRSRCGSLKASLEAST